MEEDSAEDSAPLQTGECRTVHSAPAGNLPAPLHLWKIRSWENIEIALDTKYKWKSAPNNWPLILYIYEGDNLPASHLPQTSITKGYGKTQINAAPGGVQIELPCTCSNPIQLLLLLSALASFGLWVWVPVLQCSLVLAHTSCSTSRTRAHANTQINEVIVHLFLPFLGNIRVSYSEGVVINLVIEK